MTASLRLRPDGTFRILQLTDMHLFGERGEDERIFSETRELILREKPDLLAFTGDISCDGPVPVVLERLGGLLNAVEPLGVPYTFTFGNHETDPGPDGGLRAGAVAAFLEKRPLCVFERGDPALGWGNYAVPVQTADGSRPAWVLYHLDGHSSLGRYEFSPGFVRAGDAAVSREQIRWLERTHLALRGTWGPVPAVLFDHVPLPEFNDVWMFDGIRGDRGEPVCCAPVNTGLFSVLRELGDFRAVFAGHDHTNSFSGLHMGILLAYGRCSGNYRWSLWPRPGAPQREARQHPADGPRLADWFVRGGRVIELDADGGIPRTRVALFGGAGDEETEHPPVFDRFYYWEASAEAPDRPH